MDQLIFLSNDLMNPDVQKQMRVPLQFICFAFIHGKMYRHFRSHDTFVLQPKHNRTWGNNVVYGAIFALSDFHFFIRQLDAYQSCSLSALNVNHKYDIQHRVQIKATPIRFDSLDSFSRLMYYESEHVDVHAYVANPNHPKIKRRLISLSTSYRIIDGVNKKAFKSLYREVTHADILS